MGALPKRKISRSRRNRRRAHDSLTRVHLVACETCGEMKRPHRACPACGQYRGMQILPVADEA